MTLLLDSLLNSVYLVLRDAIDCCQKSALSDFILYSAVRLAVENPVR